jgi:DNA-binding NtrC family response regulator
MKVAPERSILVVDDEESIRTTLQRVLRGEGYTVYEAESGDEALEILKDKPVQLVISDHNMPGMSGLELLKLVRDRYPNICRIMLTADSSADTIIRSINEGEVYRFIQKPWDKVALKVTIYFAFETLLLEDEKRRLLDVVRRQRDKLRALDLSADPEAELLLAEADLLKS